MNKLSRDSLKRNFLLVLSLSDDGLEMMLQRLRRLNPESDETAIRALLRQELVEHGRRNLPRYLVPIKYWSGDAG